MKKTRLFTIVALLSVIISLSACRPEAPQTNVDETDENKIAVEQTEEENNENAIVISASEIPDMGKWSEVSRYTGDIDGDGTDENVVLMTSAERDSKGELLWNDGQSWVLYVDDREESYVLLNEYIQLGNAYFEVADYYMKDGAEPRINVFVSTSAGLKIKSYAFDKTKKGYTEETIYDTKNVTEGGINKRFSSMPEMK